MTKPLTPEPSALILAPPTPPNRESYQDEEEIPHIGSPLSPEGARWLKQHDPSIISACNSAKGTKTQTHFMLHLSADFDGVRVEVCKESAAA